MRQHSPLKKLKKQALIIEMLIDYRTRVARRVGDVGDGCLVDSQPRKAIARAVDDALRCLWA